jgi:hypothetical protein
VLIAWASWRSRAGGGVLRATMALTNNAASVRCVAGPGVRRKQAGAPSAGEAVAGHRRGPRFPREQADACLPAACPSGADAPANFRRVDARVPGRNYRYAGGHRPCGRFSASICGHRSLLLVEVLAVAIMALLAVMAWRRLDGMSRAQIRAHKVIATMCGNPRAAGWSGPVGTARP